MDNENQIFSTLDAYQAAFLSLKNHTVRLQKNGGKIVFYLANSDKLKADLAKYNKGEKVSAIEFATTVKYLKSQIFTMRGQP